MNLLSPTVPFLAQLIKTGTRFAQTTEEHKEVIIVNCLSLTTASLLLIIGAIFALLLPSAWIGLPVGLECAGFLSIMLINRAGKLKTAKLSMYILQCICATHFGILLGPVIEIQLLIVFLIMASYLITKNKIQRRIFLGVSIAMLIITEVNFYYDLVPAIPLNRDTSFLLRWLSIAGILMLILEVISFYDLKNSAHQEALKKSGESKSLFVKQISHEIRTPLNGIYGIAQLLQEDVARYPELVRLRHYVQDLMYACTDAKAIVNNVLDLAEIENGKMHNLHHTAFALRPWLDQVTGIHQYAAAARKVSIQVEADPLLPPAIIGDELKLRQILNNLLSNAIKFTRPGTTVLVKATRHHQKWLLSVTDAGAGIAEEQRENIFEPFVKTTDRYVESTGLGLHITKQLTSLLGGEITLFSKPRHGSTFQVMLPLMTGEMPAIKKADDPLLNLQGYKALIIEDNLMSQKILANLLKGMGADTAVADDGAEGLITAGAWRPDIIFVDAHMPVMTGPVTIQELRRQPCFEKTLIIAVTADGFTGDGQTMIRAGADELIPKPIAFTDIRTLLRKHLVTRPVMHQG
ncbi:response regulator [Chitinophaga sp. Mgbs1]|uniref:histidine kinase n=1 Tax=Chitinophaga solisilvae TaxID=1233460 RepID=A0A433WLL5_9BACT|nr:response regulator [Chitinophaga solisilvae]